MVGIKWLVVAAVAAATQLVDPVDAIATNITGLCSPHATPPNIIKGETTFVCVNVNDKYRTVVTPKADQFTVLRISSSLNDTRIGGRPDGAFVSVSSGALRSYYKLYASNKGNVYPYMTAIISVKKGVVQGVSWDDGCYFCNAESCEPNLYNYPTFLSSQQAGQGYTCYNKMDTCAGANASSCDLTIYLGWTGTDYKGNYLSSAGLRMSQFERYSIGKYFKNLASTFSSLVPQSRFDT